VLNYATSIHQTLNEQSKFTPLKNQNKSPEMVPTVRVVEILSGIGLLFPATKAISVYWIIAMLAVFCWYIFICWLLKKHLQEFQNGFCCCGFRCSLGWWLGLGGICRMLDVVIKIVELRFCRQVAADKVNWYWPYLEVVVYYLTQTKNLKNDAGLKIYRKFVSK